MLTCSFVIVSLHIAAVIRSSSASLFPLDSVPDGVYGHSVISLRQSRQMLVVGGWPWTSSDGDVSSSSSDSDHFSQPDLFDFDSWSWQLASPSPISPNGVVPRSRHFHALSGSADIGLWVLVGGYLGMEYSNEVFLFSEDDMSWSPLLPADIGLPWPSGRAGHSLSLTSSVNDLDFLMVGGLNGDGVSGEVWSLRVVSSPADRSVTWDLLSPGGSVPSSRAFHSAAYHDGHIYIIGGSVNGIEALADSALYMLDLVALLWTRPTSINSLADGIFGHSSVIVFPYLYILGGYRSSFNVDILAVNLQKMSSQVTPSNCTARRHASLVVHTRSESLRKFIVQFGGTNIKPSSELDIFSVSNDGSIESRVSDVEIVITNRMASNLSKLTLKGWGLGIVGSITEDSPYVRMIPRIEPNNPLSSLDIDNAHECLLLHEQESQSEIVCLADYRPIGFIQVEWGREHLETKNVSIEGSTATFSCIAEGFNLTALRNVGGIYVRSGCYAQPIIYSIMWQPPVGTDTVLTISGKDFDPLIVTILVGSASIPCIVDQAFSTSSNLSCTLANWNYQDPDTRVIFYHRVSAGDLTGIIIALIQDLPSADPQLSATTEPLEQAPSDKSGNAAGTKNPRYATTSICTLVAVVTMIIGVLWRRKPRVEKKMKTIMVMESIDDPDTSWDLI